MFFKHTPLTYIAQHKLFLHSCNLRVLLQGRVWNGAVLWLFDRHHIPNCHRAPFARSGRAKTLGHGQHRKSNLLSNLESICGEIRMKWVITNYIQILKDTSLSILLQITFLKLVIGFANCQKRKKLWHLRSCNYLTYDIITQTNYQRIQMTAAKFFVCWATSLCKKC